MQVVSRSWKRQGNQFYQRVFRKQRSSVDTLTLAQRGRCWISDLQYCKMMFYFLKPFSLCNLFSSVHSSVVSNTLRPHESQHARPPCPSPTPGVHSDSHPLSLWCHPAISSSVVPFSSCSQSLPASEFFPMSQLFAWGGKVLEFQL